MRLRGLFLFDAELLQIRDRRRIRFRPYDDASHRSRHDAGRRPPPCPRPRVSVAGLARDEPGRPAVSHDPRSEEHTSELQSQSNLVCRLLLEKKKQTTSLNHALAVTRT